uniref:Secreted protein n=1 Tax=Steinernema glaseri TaxID=37863 RepID=A0A1I7ZLQ6_9BILA
MTYCIVGMAISIRLTSSLRITPNITKTTRHFRKTLFDEFKDDYDAENTLATGKTGFPMSPTIGPWQQITGRNRMERKMNLGVLTGAI